MHRNEVESLVVRQAEAWQRADAAAIAADFALDGLFISPDGVWRGPNAIAEAARAFFEVCSEVKVEIKRVIYDRNEGAIEWVWHETRRIDEQTYVMEDAIIFELQDERLIYWREYFKPL